MAELKLFSVTRISEQTASPKKSVLFVLSLVLISAMIVESRICTHMTVEQKMKSQPYMDQCVQQYEARCGWFSVRMCTFNETVPCMKYMNRTITIYRVVEQCCPGYHKNQEGKCISEAVLQGKSAEETSQGELSPSETGKDGMVTVAYKTGQGEDGVKSARTRDDDDDDDDEFLIGGSPGIYAGIICGILFVACVALLVAIHYRKKRMREEKQKGGAAEDTAQRQQMIPMVPQDTQPVTT